MFSEITGVIKCLQNWWIKSFYVDKDGCKAYMLSKEIKFGAGFPEDAEDLHTSMSKL